MTRALLFLAFSLTCLRAAPAAISFEPNRGQTDASVRYLARTAHAVIFFTDRELVFSSGASNVKLELRGANQDAAWEPSSPTGETVSYYVGRDRSRWVSGVSHYARLTRREIYPDIDVVFYASDGRLEYDFLLAPGADLSRIRLRFHGAQRLSLERDGTLRFGPIRQRRPLLYQTAADGYRRAIEGGFRLLGPNEAGVFAGPHDLSLPLTIDPVLESSTYFGGSGDDQIVASDGVISVGTTTSIVFPNADAARRKGTDVFVRQDLAAPPNLSVSKTLIFGGAGDEVVTSVAFGPRSLMIGGYTNSRDLPTSSFGSFPWQPDFAGGETDGFLAEVSAGLFGNGNLLLLTYAGTPGNDRVTGVAMNRSGGFALIGTTDGRGLPEPALELAVPPFTSQAPAAGQDGFLITANSSRLIRSLTYFGGSGDDRPLAIAYSSIAEAYYIAGETSSPDFAVREPSARRLGQSDAFLMRVTEDREQRLTVTGVTLFGGSGADRGTALAVLPDGIVALAGVTTSTDLPLFGSLFGPTQRAYGGGASDAFLAQFTPDLSRVVASSYFGGSGADEATAVAADTLGNLYLAGWTSSPDFPVRNALQSAYGGGPDDGFFVHFDGDGTLHQSTYFSGSGSDRILSVVPQNAALQNVAPQPDLTVWLAGRTTSANLPMRQAEQDALRGPADGFIARMSSSVIGAARVVSGKNLRARTIVSVGPLNGSVLAPVTVTSSDPAVVLVAPIVEQPGQASVVPSRDPDRPYIRYLYIDCLADRGGANLMLSAPGYPTRTIRADCFPVHLTFDPASPFRTTLWSLPGRMLVGLAAINPDRSQDMATRLELRASAAPVTVSIASSNPGVATTLQSSITFSPGFPFSEFNLQPAGIGETDLTFTSVLTSTPGSMKVVVGPPASAPPSISLPAGFQTVLSEVAIQRVPPGTDARLIVTSADPSRLVLATSPESPGAGRIVVSESRPIWAQALASEGEVRVTFETPGLDPVTTTVRLTTPVIAFRPDQPRSLALTTDKTGSISLVLQFPGPPGNFRQNPRTDPVRISFDSSDPAVAQVSRATIAGAEIAALAAGTTALTLRAPEGFLIDPNSAAPILVTVTDTTMRLRDLELGKDLVSSLTLKLPASATSVTITSSDPSRVLLSGGQPEITLMPSSRDVSFSVQGLASSGTATITATVAGFAPVSSTITLRPSGFAWATDSIRIPYAETNTEIGVYALDPGALLPIVRQSARAGVRTPPSVISSNPEILTVGSAGLLLLPRAPGRATLSIVQPEGFTTPSSRQHLSVTVEQPLLQIRFPNTGRFIPNGTQIAVTVSGNPSTVVTIGSSDPARLLVSSDPDTPGAVSAVLPQPPQDRVVYLQALDGQGEVTVTASVAGVRLTSMTFQLIPSGVGIVPRMTPVTVLDNSVPIALALYYLNPLEGRIVSANAIAPRPPGRHLTVEVRSSNPEIGTISGSPVSFPVKPGPATVDFMPRAAGATELRVIQPPGFIELAGYGRTTLRVGEAVFAGGAYVLGKDLVGSVAARLDPPRAVTARALPVTITSSDSARVLLSLDLDSPPAPSLNAVLPAGATSLGFYVHALADSGIVPLKVSSPGVADGVINIALSPTTIRFTAPGGSLTAILQSGPLPFTVLLAPVLPANLPPNYQLAGFLALRPGAAPVIVALKSSDPSVVTLEDSQLSFAPRSYLTQTRLRPLALGRVTLSLDAPPGYPVDPVQGTVEVTVQGDDLALAYPGAIGRNLQGRAVLRPKQSPAFREPAVVTLTSSDPSRLLLSASPTELGGATLVLNAGPNQETAVWLQALADGGAVTVTMSAALFRTTQQDVTLNASGATFINPFIRGTLRLSVASGPQRVQVVLVALQPTTGSVSGFQQAPIPGANISVQLSSSDPNVATAPDSVQFPTGDVSPQNVEVRPVGPGSALITLAPFPGSPPAASNRQLPVLVSP